MLALMLVLPAPEGILAGWGEINLGVKKLVVVSYSICTPVLALLS